MDTDKLFIIQRVGPTQRVYDSLCGTQTVAALSDQVGWGMAVPAIFRVLAAPASGAVLPRAPEPEDPIWFACEYWSCLVQMLLYSLGWARPDVGLWWWYENNKPTDDPRLRLLSEVFDADGQLDFFVAWMWDKEPKIKLGYAFEWLTGWQDQLAPVPADQKWIAQQQNHARAVDNVLGHTSWDVLHLSGHCHGPLANERAPYVLHHSEPDQRRAVVVTDSAWGWYTSLCEAGNKLPPLVDRSWYVDVFVKPVGWMGTYRRSRQTGLWFSGRHRFHTPGA